MKLLTDLEVYNLAEKLFDLVWEDYNKWSWKVQRTVGIQIISSSDSIAANIAEGYGRYSALDRKKFYIYSRGSFEETKCWLRKLYRRKIISKEEMNNYKIIVDELGPKLNGFINSTKKEISK